MAKKIGVLGGMGPKSTVEYYQYLTRKSFPEIIIYSVDFEKIMKLLESANQKNYLEELIHGIKSLERSGADFIIIASNTPHMVYDDLQKQSKVPIISIVKATAEEAKRLGLKELLLLGTKYTMQSDFYKKDFEEMGINVVAPTETDQEIINEIIFQELIQGILREESKNKVLNIIKNYSVDGIILGCTELPLLIKPEDVDIKLLNTLEIHAEKALQRLFDY